MVLKNSKWDKKAKYKYLKKHNILPTKTEKDNANTTPSTKWSSKKKPIDNHTTGVTLEDSDDEWDSDIDDALINHFYPQLSENDELTIEQKKKIKSQILANLDKDNEEEEKEKEKEKEGKESIENTIEDELDGIYLGSDDTNKLKELKPNINGADSKFDLEEFINNLDIKPKKNKRKLLHNKISDNFLEEYGLSSYQELNRNVDDYNSIYEKKQKELLTRNNLNNIPIEKLDGFIIGESSLIDKINTTDKSKNIKKSNIQILTNDEKQKDIDRQKLIEQENFYRQIKNKFNNNDDNVNKSNKLGKILEINNFDNNDVDQLAYLNNKILQNDNSKATTTLDNDLDLLLGISSDGKDDVDKVESNVKQQDDNFDTFINKLTINDKDETFKNEQHQSKLSFDKVNKKQNQNDAKDLDFLDDLLG
ncbi:hypothetical protein I503_03446 [Candida albicans SC5314]|nr:hypothetical protein MG9_03378 [Candida albicans P37037]KHC86708.1 hypothetical protein I503_03446 [Candida albicans SC5314]